MGVYIDMEMPTRCGRCDMCITEADGDIDFHKACCITWAVIKNLGEKMEDCPLVPVPPHGRLIDADEFLKRAIGTKCFRGDYALMLEELVGESTTILEAEEGE